MIAKISLALSILLAVAVGYLLLRKPNTGITTIGDQEVVVAPALQTEGGPKATVLAYINGDSLNQKYKFIVEKTSQLEGKMGAAEKKVKAEYAKRQKEVADMEAYVQKNKLTDEEKQTLASDVARMEEEMAAIEEREMGGLQKQEQNLQKELMERVSKYLEKFSQQKGIDYVINFQSGFQLILYGNKAYDITSEVVAGLNAEYELEKK